MGMYSGASTLTGFFLLPQRATLQGPGALRAPRGDLLPVDFVLLFSFHLHAVLPGTPLLLLLSRGCLLLDAILPQLSEYNAFPDSQNQGSLPDKAVAFLGLFLLLVFFELLANPLVTSSSCLGSGEVFTLEPGDMDFLFFFSALRDSDRLGACVLGLRDRFSPSST